MSQLANSKPIESYAMIGDTETAALVCSTGTIDWLCLPRFDSAACFAALLGNESHGRWSIYPTDEVIETSRRYRDDTMVLETTMATTTGKVTFIDFMPPRGRQPDVVRIIQGVEGSVDLHMELVVRFDYGSVIPWAKRHGGDLTMVAGPDGLVLHAPVEVHGENLTTVSDFTVDAGDRLPFTLTWYDPSDEPPKPIDPEAALDDTLRFWGDWAKRCTHEGRYRNEVMRSLLTLKALTFRPSGGIVAAATTSLPETLGGERNWDYRYCWLRDASFTLAALLENGYADEAHAWRDWLLRAVAGDPADMQIMYGANGERRLTELTLDWLPGYENSSPVRTGNAATTQSQLDVYGEVMDVLHRAGHDDVGHDGSTWALQTHIVDFLCEAWREPDHGIWEVRGPKRHFVHSKVMAWVAFDRAINAMEHYGVEGPLDKWKAVRDEIRAEVLDKGWNDDVGSFTQYYGGTELDASLLVLPLVGFIDANDERMRKTIDAIGRDLSQDGLLYRYLTKDDENLDGLDGVEGAFLPCSFWYACCLILTDRVGEARELFEYLLSLCNDVGLISEEYDTRHGRLVGNFPQAFTHVELIRTASLLEAHS